MPNVTLPVSDLHWTVDRPVILGIVRDLMEITQISSKTPINFYGIDAKNFQQGSTLNSGMGENRWPYDEKVVIEVEEDYNMDMILSTPVQREEYAPFFEDATLKVDMRPVYSMSKVSVNFKYRARDKNQAAMWRNEMRIRASMMRDINLHEINYSYRIPDAFLGIVEHVHELRETCAGYEEDLNEYFTGHLLSNVGLTSNLSGDEGVWSVSERQIRIQGYYDFEGAPEKGDRDEDHDNWVIGFTYVFTYQKPIACNMRYPLMVHNQLVGEKYRPQDVVYRLEDQNTKYSHSGYAYAYFESDQRILSHLGDEGLNIPAFDDFVPKAVLPTTIKVFMALVNITPEDRRTLLNLNELGDYQLSPAILAFIAQSEYQYVANEFRSILTLSLYQDDVMLQKGSLSVDALGNVKSTFDLDLRKVYHLRLGLCTDPSYLPPAAISRLQNNPVVSAQLVKAINGCISGVNGGRRDIGRNQLTDQEVLLLTGKVLDPSYMRSSSVHYVTNLYVKTNGLTWNDQAQGM